MRVLEFPGRRLRGRIVAGWLLLTVSSAAVAYFVGANWGTGLYTAGANARLRAQVEAPVLRPGHQELGLPWPIPAVPPPGPALHRAALATPGGGWRAAEGEAFAVLRIPAVGVDVAVIEGVDERSLRQGPGHYPQTAQLGPDSGRVAIAGHRTTFGAPFWSLNRVVPGDEIELVTRQGSFTYRVTASAEVGRSDAGVLEQTRAPTLVLTTCTPRFSDSARLVVFAERVESRSLSSTRG